MKPFRIHMSDDQIADLRDRLRRTRLPDEVEDAGWDYGTSLSFLRKLIHHWATAYD